MASEHLQKLVTSCERSIKNNQVLQLPKYIKRLRAIKQLDVIMNIAGESLSLLMFFARRNMVSHAQEMLSGTNPAIVTMTNAKGENALFIAVSTVSLDPSHDLALVNLLLQQDPESQLLQATTEGLIPFHDALYTGHIPLIELLLKTVPDKQLVKKGNNNMSVVDFACLSKNPHLLEWLYERYSLLHELKGEDGFGPLHLAAKTGNLSHVQYLLRTNPELKVMARDDIGMLPIFLACFGNHISVIKELLRYCGKEQLEDSQCGSVVFFACMAGRLAILQIIFNTAKVLGADLSKVLLCATPFSGLLRATIVSRSDEREIPLHLTIYTPNSNEIIRLAMIELLLSVAPNEQLEYQRKVDHQAALHISIDAGVPSITKKLIASKNIKQFLLKDNNGCTPFMSALENNRKEEAELLFSSGAAEQYAFPSNAGTHALIHVMRLNLMQIFETMVSRLSEEALLAISDQNDPLLHMSLMRPAMLSLLLRSGSKKLLLDSRDQKFKYTALHSALKYEFEKETVVMLLAHGADVNAQDINGWSPLHIVCSTGNIQYFNLLCSYHPIFNIRAATGEVPLHIAAANGQSKIAEVLLNYGTEPNSCNDKGLTPLFFAVLFGHAKVVEILLKMKADPNHASSANFPILRLALYKLNLKLIEILLKHGADINQIVSTNPLKSFKEFVIEQAGKGDILCQKIKAVMNNLKLIPNNDEPQTPTVPSQSSQLEDTAVSSRSYLKELGFTVEQLSDFEEERRYKLTKRNFHEFKFTEPLKSQEIITWLNGTITSNAAFIFPISSHGVLAFCYFDEATLAQQGCDPTKIERKRLKFDGYHIKDLDKAKSTYIEKVKFTHDSPERQITYTHEFKVSAVDRILLFQVPSDNPIKTNKAMCCPPLYIGLRFIPGGLHTNASIKSLTDSMAVTSASNCLIVQWPLLPKPKDSLKLI